MNGTEDDTIDYLGPSGDIGPVVPNVGTDVMIGGYYVPDAIFGLTGYLCEVIYYDHALTDDDRLQVEDYLKGKWGL